ncbi:hypothetical protein ACM7EQ_02370 [Pseudomonas aeruginosa]|uniref:hypothetical protein n=1 Tax=Pseudomonas aeruginosa TaxID=287 RepID=UPI00136782F7|nr:hypothetical protein [Pseudomonas aeruginosa]VZR94660.1 hypothetical protein PACF725_5519 [Pseudomonas aeruginosa]
MYLSIMFPDALPYVAMLTGGLWVTGKQDNPILAVKASKEIILTARENRTFRLYLAPCEVDGQRGLTLLSAFFDDPISPLLINTPLVAADALTEALRILPDEFKICFFDEHNRELLSCKAYANLTQFRSQLASHPLLGEEHTKQMLDQGDAWFATSTAEDDIRATPVILGEDLFPSDYVITDMTRQGFQGSPGFSTTQLERPEPGTLQEVDIIFLLQRAYAAERIVHGPLKVADDEELVDVLILGDEVTLLLQAKDSPNTAATLGTKLERKRRKAINQLSTGLSQLRGALTTIRREGNPRLRLVSGEELDIDLSTKPLVGVVIVRELFTDSYDEYGAKILDFMDKYQIPALVFDYSQLEVITRNCPSEPEFLSAVHQIFECVRDQRIYPRLRFPARPLHARGEQ